jgi:hypothetical protein
MNTLCPDLKITKGANTPHGADAGPFCGGKLWRSESQDVEIVARC